MASLQSTVLWFFCAASPALAITGGTPPAEDDTRYDAVAALSFGRWIGLDPDTGNSYDHNWYCGATLVSEQVAITANHCVTNGTPDFYALRFRRKPDGSIGTVDAGVDSYHHVWVQEVVQTDLDFSVLHLQEPVTHITPIPTLTYGVWGLSNATSIWNAGWGKEGPEFDEGPRNELLLCQSPVISTEEDRIAFKGKQESTTCGINVHDSGSPVLIENAEGELRVGGIVTNGSFDGSSGSGPNLSYFAEDTTIGFGHNPYTGRDLAIVVRDPLETECLSSRDPVIPVSPVLVNAGSVLVEETKVSGWLEDVFSAVSYPIEAVDSSLETMGYESFGGELAYPLELPASQYFLHLEVDPGDTTQETFEDNFWKSSQTLSLSPNPAEAGRVFFAVWLNGADFDGFLSVFDGDDGTLAVLARSESRGAEIMEPNLERRSDNIYPIELGGLTLTLSFDGETWEIASSDPETLPYGNDSKVRSGRFGFSAGVYLPGDYLPEDAVDGFPAEMAIQSANGTVMAIFDTDEGEKRGYLTMGNTSMMRDNMAFFGGEGALSLNWDESRWTLVMGTKDVDALQGKTLFLRAPEPPLEPEDTGETETGMDSGQGAQETGDSGPSDILPEPPSGCACSTSQTPENLVPALFLFAVVLGVRRRENRHA
jgi:MYXO-CTERM domain-containing protein